jgi:hypothetical protein
MSSARVNQLRFLSIEGKLGIQYFAHIELDGETEGLPVDIEFKVVEEGGRLLLDRLVLTRRAGTAIDSTVMRELPLPGLLLRALSSGFGLMRRVRRGEFEGPIDIGDLDDDDRAVLSYKLAYAIGQPPTAAVAEHFGISTTAAAKRIERLRDAGRLSKTERGRRGI